LGLFTVFLACWVVGGEDGGWAETYFKPGRRGYFDRQPGRPVRLKPDPTTPSAVK
jgi:hypothetical protein